MVTGITVDGFSRDLLRPKIIRALCVRAGMRPQRSAGQHYLIDARVLERIVEAVDSHADDTILEIGAGFGVLTTALASRLKNEEHLGRIIALERERRVIPILREIVEPFGNVEVVEADVLTWLREPMGESMRQLPQVRDIDAMRRAGPRSGGSGTRMSSDRAPQGSPSPKGSLVREAGFARSQNEGTARDVLGLRWKLAANLPYGITSDFLRLLFDRIADGSLPAPERIVLLLQREVVDRMLGSSGMSVLTILTQLHGVARRVTNVPSSAFWPPPKVESAVIALDHIRTPAEITKLLHPITRDQFLAFIRLGFAHPRRQLLTNLSMGQNNRSVVAAALASRKFRSDIRSSVLSFAQWVSLARELIPTKKGPDPVA